jgi:succinate dehydrogenase flavin-adding protein (antitoxin of CptAB toxin-antitoxin module)
MSEGETAALARLLAMPDNDLLDLVMGRAECPEPHLRGMIEKLRSA